MRLIKDSVISIVLMVAFAVVMLDSCAPNVVYFQDLQDNVTVRLQEVKAVKLKPGDRVRVYVYSRDKELTDMFNMGTGNSGMMSGSSGMMSYTVTDNGDIEIPILGPIHAEGLTRLELANAIKYKLLAGKLVREPNVIVDFANLSFYTLGDIGPSRHEIDRDQITLLEALSMSGDLNLTGRRDNVLVLRTEDGKQTPYRVDLTSAESIYSSPVFYLQQNDIIYVEPNRTRAGGATLNGNLFRTPASWVSMLSLAVSVWLLIKN